MARPSILITGIAVLTAGFVLANTAAAVQAVGDLAAVHSDVASGSIVKVDTQRRLGQRGQNGRVYGRDGNGVKHHGYLFSPKFRTQAYRDQGTQSARKQTKSSTQKDGGFQLFRF